MSTRTYRTVVVVAILSSFLAGFHMPVLHDIIDHGASPPWDVLAFTALLTLVAVVCGWTLLRRPPTREH